jgi:HPt (histidine-containing phosphotransfer) domain-containing protein
LGIRPIFFVTERREADRVTRTEFQGTYADKVAALKLKFVSSIPQRAEDIRAMLVDHPDGAGETPPRRLHRLLHDLAGNAAMLGCDEIKDAVTESLKMSAAADHEGRSLSPDQKAIVRTELEDLIALADTPEGTAQP